MPDIPKVGLAGGRLIFPVEVGDVVALMGGAMKVTGISEDGRLSMLPYVGAQVPVAEIEVERA